MKPSSVSAQPESAGHQNRTISVVVVSPASLSRRMKRKLMPAKPRTAKSRPTARAVPRNASPLGALPEWNLADLYAGIDDPNVKRDLDRGDAECIAFEQAYKGTLAALVEAPDAGA